LRTLGTKFLEITQKFNITAKAVRKIVKNIKKTDEAGNKKRTGRSRVTIFHSDS
jgi:hypothetical protein